MIVNIEKRHVFLIVGVLVFFGGLFFVNAFGTSVPATLGHSGGEIEVDDAFCDRVTGHGCGVDVDTDTSAVTECLDDEFLDGDGSCLTAEEIVGVAGGGEMVCDVFGSPTAVPEGYRNSFPVWVGVINEFAWCRDNGYVIAFSFGTTLVGVGSSTARYNKAQQEWYLQQCSQSAGCLVVASIECCK